MVDISFHFGRRLVLAVLLTIFWSCSFLCNGQASEVPMEPAVQNTDAIVHSMCNAQAALLGENPTHSFGNGLALKVELVRRLINECHFNALFIESGMYDYIHIQRSLRAGRDISGGMISAAIGGLWANEEMQSLIPFLRSKIKTGAVTLAGLDDQIGAGSYASLGMSSDLVQPLSGRERERCLAVFQRHLQWQYTDKDPYTSGDKEKLVGCLNGIEAALDSQTMHGIETEESRAMVESLKRNFARDFTENDFTKEDQALRWANDRELSMYANFTWFRKQIPAHSKVIIWAATVHTAKQLDGIKGFEGRVPLGFYVHRDFGSASFSLGITARSGFYTFKQRPLQQLSAAPADSIEARLLNGDRSIAFVTGRQFKSLGLAPSRILGTTFVDALWTRVFDGIVSFRDERPPIWINRSKP